MKKRYECNGTVVYYRDIGEGDTVVLLHGYLESARIWDGFADRLAEDHRVIVPDLPGHGASFMPGSVHSMEALARVVFDLLEELAAGKAVIAGHSMGGYVTMAMAALHPERLNAYVLFHSTPFADTEEKRVQRDRECTLIGAGRLAQIAGVNIPNAFANDNVSALSHEVERAIGIAKKSPEDGTIAILKGMKLRPDRTTILQDSALSVLLIGGMQDNYIPAQVFERMSALAPHASTLKLQRSGHMGFVEEQGEALRGMRSFLAGLGASS